MNRKSFLKKVSRIGLFSGSLFLALETKSMAILNSHPSKENEQSSEQKFKEIWIKSFLKNLETQFDEQTRVKFMEDCGRDCARNHAIGLATSGKSDINKLLEELAGLIGKQNVYKNGNTIHLKYTRCYCPLVANGPERLSKTYCYCSRGWILEMFETALEKSVEVKTIQTIKRGDPTCKFIVQI